jgi:tetratricopeptide (TPR) repeat protein
MMAKKYFILLAIGSLLSSESAHARSTPQECDLRNVGCVFPSQEKPQSTTKEDEKIIKDYLDQFARLAKSEKWEEILSRGSLALEAAKRSNRQSDEAKICAQLTSTSFYRGDYDQALIYATRCHELSEKFEDPSLLIRALYSESAVHRAFASSENEGKAQQEAYQRAVDICEKATELYTKKGVSNLNLKGKVYFNLGAAHADNPQGDLEKAKSCYLTALECYKKTHAADDILRTTVRLGKLYLLQKDYEQCQRVLDEVRPFISSERLAMQADYLEAQLKLALGELKEAVKISQMGLERAKALGAKEDESRLQSLSQKIDAALNAQSETQ